MKKDYWLPVLGVVSWVATLLILPQLPDQIPMHWAISGEVNRWGSKFNLIWLGALAIGIWALMAWLPEVDPKRENYRKFSSTYRVIRGIIVVMMIALNWIVVTASMSHDGDAFAFIKILMGIVFIVIGTLLTRVHPTRFIGVRTPWTLADPVIWKKTHRLAGLLMAIAGLLFIAGALFFPGPFGLWIPVATIVGGGIVDVIYSALLWRRYHGGEKLPPPLSR